MTLKQRDLAFLDITMGILFFLIYSIRVSAVSENIAPPSYQTEREVKVSIFKNEKQLEVKKFEIILGSCSYSKDYSSYKGKITNGVIVSFVGNSLGFFPVANNLSSTLCEDHFDMASEKISGGCSDLTEGELTIDMPYFPNGKYADIYDPFGKKVLTIDLASKATCNENGKCDTPIEDSENCPRDCVKGETKLDPVLMEKAGIVQTDTENNSTAPGKWILIAAGIILVLASLGFWLWRRYREVKKQTY
ncbi:MAG: hypothetical protein UX02_C0001G0218 [Candidatus Moranbacteria bacterium GW2011_GWC1_45_18]|nr:MAG: hypothetical protein UT79_C0002G0179 [Candidatus Moranbacteria bacterium GW2011_GWC2_40_12]KKT32592.1 MAG: hypothetical protein UW19_C0018G0014 [Candidatus Moranbacteria bacterium GW2011_GWF2_44_10]KKT70713.1 MAG: hypothetical protein UW66_C0038G0004 [Candidatus Moranbacteria bacterium GW2011_GWF1_44_4]KKU00770.1 MAG: hypothetical protein UX02_C0001G0218 [Candidatus Moranbacteria bacterium GW2011_GWC1_45_18]